MAGLQTIVVRGLGQGSVLLPAGLLLAYATAFFGLAVWRFLFERAVVTRYCVECVKGSA